MSEYLLATPKPGSSSSRADFLANWIRLIHTPGVGPETARKLLAAFGLPNYIFEASYSALTGIVSDRVARAILMPLSDVTRALIEKTQEWIGEVGNHVCTVADLDYPKTLLHIPDPPLMLYVKGRASLLSAPSIAVVGSRHATAQGSINAEQFSEALSNKGVAIVSGLALGIDAAAHRGGLKGRGSSIAVIGTGIDIVYPARNKELAHLLVSKGCIVSEYPLGMPAIATNFPRRNRIISGLSRGVLVVEAAAQSGSLITARMAAEQGREVFAIPGSIHSPLSKGCHQLIKQGVKLVESAQDILEELQLGEIDCTKHLLDGESSILNFEEDPVLSMMGFDPCSIDTLASQLNFGVAELSAHLLSLELQGHVEQLPGGLVHRVTTK